jgi:competence protein ComEC
MPLEALALLFDIAGAGRARWWLTARSLDLLLWLAHAAASAPGAVASLPAMPGGAYALMVGGRAVDRAVADAGAAGWGWCR